MKIAFKLGYFGDNFHGSQQQSNRRTVEGEFITACIDLGLIRDRKSSGFSISGRTDRGVHARCQICSFFTDHPERAVCAINEKLPGDIWCFAYAEVDDSYNPRYDVFSRKYRYYFYEEGLDHESMQKAAQYIKGVHDFTSFAKIKGKDPERKILESEVFTDGEYTVFEIEGHSFLWNMVRCLAYALNLCGKGLLSPEEIRSSLENPGMPRYPAMPPEGLLLWDLKTKAEFKPMIPGEKSLEFKKEEERKLAQGRKILEVIN